MFLLSFFIFLVLVCHRTHCVPVHLSGLHQGYYNANSAWIQTTYLFVLTCRSQYTPTPNITAAASRLILYVLWRIWLELSCQHHGWEFQSRFCNPPMTVWEKLGQTARKDEIQTQWKQFWQPGGVRINFEDRSESEAQHSDASTCTISSSSSLQHSAPAEPQTATSKHSYTVNYTVSTATQWI